MFIFLMLVLACLSAYSQTVIPFQTGGNSQTLTAPILTHTYQGNVLKYTFSAENMSLYTEFASDNNMYAHLYMKSIGFTSEVGKAELPTFYDYVPVASENATITLLNTNGSEIPNMDIWPFQQPVNISDSISYPFYRDSLFYATNAYYPNYPVEILEYQNIDDRLYAFIRVSPIQYNPVQRKIRCFSEINYSISNYYIPSSASESDDGIIRTQEDYLIVCNDSALDVISDFVEWKEMQGFNVHIIHSNNWTQHNAVRDSVRAYYQHYSNCKYLLVAGDHAMVPAEIIEKTIGYINTGTLQTKRYPSDYDLSCKSNMGTPQIAVGRIPSGNLSELSSILNKIISYQRLPLFGGKALHCANFEDENKRDGYEDYLDVRACEEIKTFIEDLGFNVSRVYYADSSVVPLYYNRGYNGGALPSELLKPAFPWDGNKYQIINEFNANPNIVLYSGHGSPRMWDLLKFSTAEVPMLSNTIHPIVLSMACLTGKYVNFIDATNYSPLTNLAYYLLKSIVGGASAVVAATEEVKSDLTEIWTMCLYDSFFPGNNFNPMLGNHYINHSPNSYRYSIGLAMLNASSKFRKTYSGPVVYDLLSALHCFGDPSTELYTGNPEDLSTVEIKQINDSIIVDTHGIENCNVLLIPKDRTESHLFMRADSITGHFVFPNIITSYNISVQKHNSAICYYDSYDIYLQNFELTDGLIRRYEGKNIFVGRNVTNEVPQGEFIIRSGAKLFVKANNKVHMQNNVVVETGGTFKIE